MSETFDYKPKLNADNLKARSQSEVQAFWIAMEVRAIRESGIWISDLFPHLPKEADRLWRHQQHSIRIARTIPKPLSRCIPASFQFIRPSMGSWFCLRPRDGKLRSPRFIALNPLTALGGSRYYGSAFFAGDVPGHDD